MTDPGTAEKTRLAGLAAQIALTYIDGDEPKWMDLVNRDLDETIDALCAFLILEAHLAHGDTGAVRAHFAELALRAEIHDIDLDAPDHPSEGERQ